MDVIGFWTRSWRRMRARYTPGGTCEPRASVPSHWSDWPFAGIEPRWRSNRPCRSSTSMLAASVKLPVATNAMAPRLGLGSARTSETPPAGTSPTPTLTPMPTTASVVFTGCTNRPAL